MYLITYNTLEECILITENVKYSLLDIQVKDLLSRTYCIITIARSGRSNTMFAADRQVPDFN